MTAAISTTTGPWTLVGEGLRHADPARLRVLALRTRHDLVLDALRRQGTVAARLSLAAALAGMGRSEDELTEAVELYEQVLDGEGPRLMPAVDQRHLVQAAFLAGRYDLVERGLQELPQLTDAVVSGLRADLKNPVVSAPGTVPHGLWEELFGERFVQRGLAAPRVAPDGACLFDGLGLEPGRTVDGPLVSVIVPTYRPDEGLITSVRSILAQSHAHLEVLLVDDCSGEGYDELFARAEALDPRVRLIRLARNGGSYLARNTALRQAAGEFVTTQDADDWSHPERLAAQVAAMAERPESVASHSEAIRCRPDLTRQWFGYSPERMNASSLLVRREVLQRLEGFDQIRKGADSEMIERLRLLGEGALVDVAAPLAVTRLAEGSLSRADFSLGRHSPDRVLFRSSFRWWHRQAARAGRPGAVPEVEELRVERKGRRPFPVPRSFRRGLPGEEETRTAYPLVVLTDLAEPLPEVAARAAGDASGAVAVLGRECFLRRVKDLPAWHPTLLEAGRDGAVDLLTDADPVRAEVLVVTDAALLALPALPLPGVTAGEVLVVATPPGPDEPPRDLEEAGRTVREWLGVAPTWVARGAADQQTWAADGWTLPLLNRARVPAAPDAGS